MNRKLLVIAIVPLLVGFAGAAAFSEFQSSISKTVTVTTGVAEVYETVSCVASYVAPGTTLNLNWYESGGNLKSPAWGGFIIWDGHYGKACSGNTGWNWDPDGLDKGNTPVGFPITFLGPTINSATFKVLIGNMAPGDWVLLKLVESITPWSTLPATLTYYSPALSPASPGVHFTYVDPPSLPICYSPDTPLSHSPTVGYEWCASGPMSSLGALKPGSPSPTTYTICPIGLFGCHATPDPHGVPGSENINYVLVGLDVDSPNGYMGTYASLGFTIGAAAP